MPWFKRSKDNISPDSQKKDLPDGLWEKCPSCDHPQAYYQVQCETY